MSWLLISEADQSVIGGPFDEQPVPAEGERVVEVAIGYPDKVLWSPTKAGFVDIVTAAPLLTVGRFKLLFTYQERAALRAAAQTSDLIADFLDLLNGFTDGVALDDPILTQSINTLVPAGLLTSARAEDILAGRPPA